MELALIGLLSFLGAFAVAGVGSLIYGWRDDRRGPPVWIAHEEREQAATLERVWREHETLNALDSEGRKSFRW
jgi:hypothetical protein